MGRGGNQQQPARDHSGPRASSRARSRALRTALGEGTDNGAGEPDYDALYARLAECMEWTDEFAPVALRLVDALWHGEHQEFAEQTACLRDLLAADGVEHQGRRVIAGLATMRAASLLAKLHGVPRGRFRARLHDEADQAKRLHCFPWHLLDG